LTGGDVLPPRQPIRAPAAAMSESPSPSKSATVTERPFTPSSSRCLVHEGVAGPNQAGKPARLRLVYRFSKTYPL
jgi:hypothetical protein